MIRFKKTAMALAISSTLLLAACGGGGGSSNKDDGGQTETVGTLSGSAIKGLLKGATVTAYELDAQGHRLGVVGQTTTGNDGRYNLQLDSSYQGGTLEILVAAAAGTTMLCDVVDGCGDTAFGQEMPVPAGLELSSLSEGPKAGETLEGAVTPWTHMAAARAKKLIEAGDSPSAAATKAAAEVSSILGFDIAKTQAADLSVVDSNASADVIKYAAATAALSAILLEDPAKAQEKLAQLAVSFDDGKFDDNDDVKIGQIKIHLQKVVNSSHFIAKGNPKAAGDLSNVVVKLPDAGEYVPPAVDEDLLDGSDVEKFKAFTNQVRAWVGTLQETDFKSPLAAVEVDTDTLEAVLGDDTVGVAQLLGETLGQTLEYLNADLAAVQNALDQQSSLNVPIRSRSGETLGTLAVAFSSANGVTLTLNGTINGKSGQESLSIKDLALDTNIPASAFADGVFASFTASQVSLKLSGSLSTSKVDLTLDQVALQLETSKPVEYSGDLTEETLREAVSAASLKGEVSILNKVAAESFKGALGLELVRLALPNAQELASVKALEVSGSFGQGATSFEASARLNISNAAQFDTFGFLDHDDSRYVEVRVPVADILPARVKPTDTGITSSWYVISGDDGFAEAWRWDSGSGFYGEESRIRLTAEEINGIQGVLGEAVTAKYPDLKLTAVDYFWSYGFAKEDAEATFNVDLDLERFERDDYFLQGSLTLSAGLKLPELPQARITATLNRTRLDGGNLNATLEWDGGSYNLSFQADDLAADVVPATLELSNALGYRLVLETADLDADKVQLTGAAYVGSTKVGNVETTADGVYLIRYTDGSFESLY